MRNKIHFSTTFILTPVLILQFLPFFFFSRNKILNSGGLFFFRLIYWPVAVISTLSDMLADTGKSFLFEHTK